MGDDATGSGADGRFDGGRASTGGFDGFDGFDGGFEGFGGGFDGFDGFGDGFVGFDGDRGRWLMVLRWWLTVAEWLDGSRAQKR